MSALGEISQPVCWEYISRNRQSPTRACHLPQGCRTLIFSLRVSPMMRLSYRQTPNVILYPVLPNRSPAVCSGPFPSPHTHHASTLQT